MGEYQDELERAAVKLRLEQYGNARVLLRMGTEDTDIKLALKLGISRAAIARLINVSSAAVSQRYPRRDNPEINPETEAALEALKARLDPNYRSSNQVQEK